jgi:hypothetical protein
MKTGNVILAIFLWLCIPGSFVISLLFGVFGGVYMFLIGLGAPLLFFILGLIVLLTGMEKKPLPPSVQPIIVQQPIQPSSQQQVVIPPPKDDVIKKEERGEYLYNRNDLVYGMIFIGFGIVVFILALWIEPLVNNLKDSQWLIIVIRLMGVISIIAGIIGIISALIPRKQ